jgi:hypothetical protein
MLKWISKSGTFIQFTIFIVILLAFWIPAFVHPSLPVLTPADGPLYKLLLDFLYLYPALTVAVSLLFVIIQALVLFYVYQSNGFFGRSNFLPAIIILLAYSWNGNYQTMHALLPAGVFIIIALNALMSMYGQPAAYHHVFTTAFSLGIASLFYIPLTYMLLLIWFTFITYRISGWREYAVSVIGYLLPFIYYVSWLFWSDSLPEGLSLLTGSLFNLVLPARLSLINTIWLSVSAFFVVVTMMAVLNVMGDKLISLRRKAWVLFNFSLTSIIVVLFAGWPILSTNYLFVIPMSFFITGSLMLIKRSFWFEMLALVYFLLLISMRVYLII